MESLKNPHLLKSNSFHTSFQINGESFTNSEELVQFSQSISNEINQFLRAWFSTDPHIVVMTSGSTGSPKSIHLRKDFMINSALATGRYFQLGEHTKALCCLPIKFIAGKMMLVRALTLGWDLDVIESTSNPLKEITKDKEEAFPDSSLGSSTYSNKEAMKFSIDSVNKAGKIIGQAQKRVVDIFTSDMKNGRYDRIDLSRSIHKGNIRDTSFSKREVLKTLFYDLKDRFTKYGRRKKN